MNYTSPPLPSYPSYQPPLGMTAEDIKRQSYQQAMDQMGYKPPVIPPSDPYLAYQFIQQQAAQVNQSKQQQQIDEIQRILKEDLPTLQEAEDAKRYELTKYYRSAFEELLRMQNDTSGFSLKKAVFIVENAYHDNTMRYEAYTKLIAAKVKVLKTLMKREKISARNNLGKNYLIQKLFSERVTEYKDGKVSKVHNPYRYDFEDFMGDIDWTKMFVSKLLTTGKGQCHSMPLLYLILAREINTNAWLAFSPQHSYIVFNDNNNTFYNYETTNGNPAASNWLMASGYVNSEAIKNKIYLDTLGKNELTATLLADLIMGYTGRFGYDTFTEAMIDSLIILHPKSIQGQIFRADLMVLKTNRSMKRVGNPPLEQLQYYPEAYANYTALIAQRDYIDDLGYMQMSREKYEEWLTSLNSSKRTQEKELLKTQIIENARKNN